jgi:transaldolase/glucose-6-phosphate isomerase
MNPLKELQQHGQSLWLDFLARRSIAQGELKALVENDGICGVTSNPAIFEKAIGHGDDYDDPLRALLKSQDRAVGDLYETLAVEDIQHAAAVLKPVYDKLDGADGYVSLEVSPYLASDTDATVAEARRLWKAVDRKNLMIKVPATEQGIPAIRTLIGEGINVNITLLFAQKRYADVLEAYIAGLEAYRDRGGDLRRLASVASFFVSRIDTEADKRLNETIAAANDPTTKAALAALKGKVAIANAKLAYRHYEHVIDSDRWKKLATQGARVQRLLWASTGTKNKAYRDTLYVEELIGPDTVNTVPPATLDAFRDHGKVRDSLEEDITGAERVLAELKRFGVSLDEITKKLVDDGVALFADAFDKLLSAIAAKRAKILDQKLNGQTIQMPAELAVDVERLAKDWSARGVIREIWARKSLVWTGTDEHKWLGWLDAVAQGRAATPRYQEFADWVKAQGFADAIVIGMGGSSLGPEVLAKTFAQVRGFPKLGIIDSTDPAQVQRTEHALSPGKTLFIVSSKSGSTTEPNVLMDYFFERTNNSGRQFVAVTDPGSSLEKTAKERGFAHIFHGVPSIGGRYSVLSPFGLVPAAAAGIDIAAFLDSIAVMVRACGPDVPPPDNPGVQLGLVLGAAWKRGRDKVTFSASDEIADFGAWCEQLIAESTGKLGKALIPLEGETLGKPGVYGGDRVFIDLRVGNDTGYERGKMLAALEEAGHPVVRIALASPAQIGQEFFRFEMATAVAGAMMGINPFDQPDVEAAKIKTRELTAAFEKSGALPGQEPVVAGNRMSIYTDEKNAAALRSAGAGVDVASWLKAHFARIAANDYVAILAYVDRNDHHLSAVHAMRMAIRDAKRVATCVGFGPRFLHSTGQAYKGGPNTGVFLQVTTEHALDVAIPGSKASFGVIEAAQARGDFDVLTDRGRRALRLHIKGDLEQGLSELGAMVRDIVK